jgi:hypothetical protein
MNRSPELQHCNGIAQCLQGLRYGDSAVSEMPPMNATRSTRSLLRPRHHWPRRRASEPRDELPSPHPQSLMLIGVDPIVFRAVWEPVTLGPDAVD